MMSDYTSNVLQLKLLGSHVPSFKNKKLLTRGKLITDPKKQRWMQQAIRSIESQLRYALQTNGEETETGRLVRSLTAWCRQFDDSVDWIPEQHCYCQHVTEGQQGAVIEIQRL